MKLFLVGALLVGLSMSPLILRAADDDDTIRISPGVGGGFGHGKGRGAAATTQPAAREGDGSPGDEISLFGTPGRRGKRTAQTQPVAPAVVDDGIPPIIKQLEQYAYENLMIGTRLDAAALGLTPAQTARIAAAARAHDEQWSALMEQYRDHLFAINANEVAVGNAIRMSAGTQTSRRSRPNWRNSSHTTRSGSRSSARTARRSWRPSRPSRK